MQIKSGEKLSYFVLRLVMRYFMFLSTDGDTHWWWWALAFKTLRNCNLRSLYSLVTLYFLMMRIYIEKIILPDWLVSHWTYLCSSRPPDSDSWEILEFIQSVETRHGSQGFYISLVSCIFWILKCFEAIIQTSDNMWQIFQILHQHQ